MKRQETREKLKERRGITLVALVITIIILLILAGVTISTLSENGLFGKSQEAVKLSRKAALIEDINLEIWEAEIAEHLEKNSGQSLSEILRKYGEIDNEDNPTEVVLGKGDKLDPKKSQLIKGLKNEKIKVSELNADNIRKTGDAQKTEEKRDGVSALTSTTHTSKSINYSWDQLETISKMISNNKNITRNTAEISVKLNGETNILGVGDTTTVDGKEVRILGFNHDTLTNKSAYGTSTQTGKAGISFEYVNFIDEEFYSMNYGNTNDGGWETTFIRELINDEGFGWPSAIKEKIKQVEKSYIVTYNDPELETSNDYFWLLSCAEIWDNSAEDTSDEMKGLAITAEGNQYKYYQLKNPHCRISDDSMQKFMGSDACSYWLRSPVYGSDEMFCLVDQNGICYANPADETWPIAPGFCI